MKRSWQDARDKVEAEGHCRICGTTQHLEAAHVTSRSHDRPRTHGAKTLYVDPVSIVPLCGPFPEGCHGSYDTHKIDILQHLFLAEQVRAVEDLGSIELARKRLAPSAYPNFRDLAAKEER